MVKKSFKEIMSGIVEWLKTVPEKLKVIPEFLKKIPGFLKTIPEMIKALPETVKALPEKFKVLLNKIKDFFENLKVKLKESEEVRRLKKEAKKAEKDPSDMNIFWTETWFVCREIGRWAYRLRSILLALPVIVASVVLAVYSSSKLPEYVGLNMQTTGEYATVISRNVAVMGPLALTAMCLLLMFCSKKVLYPWLISVFSLALPLLFIFTSTFP